MSKSKQFTLEWFKEFGWLNNPFKLEIFNPVDRYLAGLEKERQKLNYFVIENYRFGTIRGDKGSGKSLLLLWLKQSLSDYKGAIIEDFYHAEKRGVSLKEQVIDNLTGVKDKVVMRSLFSLGLKKLINKIKRKPDPAVQPSPEDKSIYDALYHRKVTAFQELLPFFQKKLKSQRLVLLIDDAHLLTDDDNKFVSDLLASELPVQVITTIESDGKSSIDGKDALKMHLSQMSFDEMKDMIKRRIESVGGKSWGNNPTYPFNDHIMHSIYSKADKNPLETIKICYDQAVKLSLKHLADRKKGILPRAERPEVFTEKFDEQAEYRKLVEEERKKHDPNAFLMDKDVEEELKQEKKKVDKAPQEEEEEENEFIAPAAKQKTPSSPPPRAESAQSYQIQVHEHDLAVPKVVEREPAPYEVKEAKPKAARVLDLKTKDAKKKPRSKRRHKRARR